jgi:hypothetical protein
MGEDSIFNAELSQIRDDIVGAYTSKDPAKTEQRLKETARYHANRVVNKMLSLAANATNEDKGGKPHVPRRVVDKMLFNYRNIGIM